MTLTTKILASLIVVLLALATAALAQPPTNAQGKRPTDNPSSTYRADWENIPQSKRDAGLEKAEQRGLFARFQYADGVAAGRFISVNVTPSTGVLSDLTLRDGNQSYKLLDSATPTPFQGPASVNVTGAVLHVVGGNFTVMVHNNPTGLVTWRSGANGTSLTFDLSNGVTTNASGKEVRVFLASRHGHLLTNGNQTPTVNGEQVTFTLDAGEMVLFRFHPSRTPDSATLHDQNAAFTAGRLGAVVQVMDGAGTPVEDRQDISVRTKATQVGNGRLRLEATSEDPSRRVLFVTVDGGTLDASRLDAITVRIGGAAAARQSVQQVLQATNAAVNFTVVDGNVQLVINVPHFSTQTIDVEQASASGTTNSPTGDADPTSTPGPGIAAFLVGLTLLVAVLGRRRR